jgi:extradiol dioxygenase family protein
MSALQPFHLALPVNDLAAAREFYCGLLGFETGRTSDRWIDLNMYGHQVTLHLVDDSDGAIGANPVDGDQVPARHFGVILQRDEWQKLADKMTAAGTAFLIAPRIRFAGEIGEQATMFFHDPAGNALEFKSFNDLSQVFAT